MDHDLSYAAQTIAPRGTLMLRNAAGRRIDVLRGSVWLTQERDRDDVFIGTGQDFTVQKSGDTVLQALGVEPAVLMVAPPPPPKRGESGHSPSLAQAIDACHARQRARTAQAGARPTLRQAEREARRLRGFVLDHMAARIAALIRMAWRGLRRWAGVSR